MLCAATTTLLQNAIDAAATAGGGYAVVPCGFHATGALQLHAGVRLSSAHCTVTRPDVRRLLTLGACSAAQMHIVEVRNGSGIAISDVRFDATNLTDGSTRSAASVVGGSGAVGFLLEGCHFLNINTSSQGFSAIQLSGCSGCIVRGNYVPRSGGDALNFNSGEYVVSENLVENVGDGCIAMNNNAFGVVAHNVLRRCNLGVGAGPAGQAVTWNSSTPFTVSSNLIEDCDFGVLLGWFGYAGRIGPTNCIVAHNIIRRVRSAAIQNNGGPGAFDGAMIIEGNHITHSGFPATQPPHTSGPGPGHGIYAVSLRDVHIMNNQLSHGRGDGITAMGLHFVVGSNVLSADAAGSNATAISVADAVDVAVSGNDIRGFARGVAASDKDRVTVRANSIDVSHSTASVGVSVGAGVARCVVSENTVSGSASADACVAIDGAASASRVARNNECW